MAAKKKPTPSAQTVVVTCDRLPLDTGVYCRDQVLVVGEDITPDEAVNYEAAERVARV